MSKEVNLKLSEEDYNFLKELGSELKTQDNLGTAKPLVFKLMYKERIYGISPDSPYDDDCIIVNESKDLDTPEETKQYIINKFNDYKTIKAAEENNISKQQLFINTLKDNSLNPNDYSSFDDLEELNNVLKDLGADTVYSHYRNQIIYKGEFLTKQSVLEHFKENAHHYPIDTKIFIDCGWRNPVLERLLNIVENTFR